MYFIEREENDMIFNSEAYDKLFPRPEVKPAEVVESMVETFKPTEEEKNKTPDEVKPSVEDKKDEVNDDGTGGDDESVS